MQVHYTMLQGEHKYLYGDCVTGSREHMMAGVLRSYKIVYAWSRFFDPLRRTQSLASLGGSLARPQYRHQGY